MSQETAISLARKFLSQLAAGVEPGEIAKSFSVNVDINIPGDVGALPWIGKRRGREALEEFLRKVRVLLEPVRFHVEAIIADENRQPSSVIWPQS